MSDEDQTPWAEPQEPVEPQESTAEESTTDDLPSEDLPSEDLPSEDLPSEDLPADEPMVVDETTGHPGVHEVLVELDALGGLDVHEHVAVFETAHRGLRRALDDGGE